MIQAVIFDFGNVICRVDNNRFLESISAFTDKSVSELNHLIYETSGLPEKYETGLITSDEFFNAVVKRCQLSIEKRQFIDAFTDIFTPIPTTFELIRELKPNYKVALLSNTNEWDFERKIRTIDGYDLFDAVTLSFKVKAMKPDPKIYQDTLTKLELDPQACVFIDDIIENVRGASQLGIHGIHYTAHQPLLGSLKGLGISFSFDYRSRYFA